MPCTAVSSSNRFTFRILPLRASTTNVHSNRMCDGDGNGDNDDILTQRFQTKHNPNEMNEMKQIKLTFRRNVAEKSSMQEKKNSQNPLHQIKVIFMRKARCKKKGEMCIKC